MAITPTRGLCGGDATGVAVIEGCSLTPTLSQREREQLLTGVIVGSAVVDHCAANNGQYQWHLSDVKRLKRPRKPKRMPQPVWFKPF